MRRTLLFLVLIALPNAVCADCIITDTPYKFEVVCSGYNPMSAPSGLKKNAKTAQRSGTSKRLNSEEKANITPVVNMSKEELQFMQTRNQQDGYRGKRSRGAQVNKKSGVGQNHNT